jgi:hypothetical protein
MLTRMFARRVGSVYAIGLIINAGCSGSDRPQDRVMVRDSAGVAIVESTAPAWAEGGGWTVGETPSVDIGGRADESAYDLFQVVGAVRLADGRIIIADAGTQQLRFYAPDGTHLHTAGGVGEGPGELTGLGLMVTLPGDTLLTFDFRQVRISRFDHNGTFLDAHSLAGIERASLRMIGALGDGAILSRSGGAFAPRSLPPGVGRDTALYLVHQLPVAHLDTVGRFPDTERFVKNEGQLTTTQMLPFGRQTVVSTSGDQIVVGIGDTNELRVYNRSGAVHAIIRWDVAIRPVTPDQVEAYKQAERGRLGTSGNVEPRFRAMFEQALEQMPYPSTHRPYDALWVDRDGSLWVLDPIMPSDTALRFQVFDSGGKWLGGVSMPERFRPTDLGRDYVLGVWADDDDIEHVRLYPLLKP